MTNKVGFWWSDKKCQKINVIEFEERLNSKGFQLIKLDLNAPLEPQGPFAAIVHKISDIMVKAQQNDKLAQIQIKHFEVSLRYHSLFIHYYLSFDSWLYYLFHRLL